MNTRTRSTVEVGIRHDDGCVDAALQVPRAVRVAGGSANWVYEITFNRISSQIILCRKYCKVYSCTFDATSAEIKHLRIFIRWPSALVQVLVGQKLRAEPEGLGEVGPESPLGRNELQRGDAPYFGPLLEFQGQGSTSIGSKDTVEGLIA